MSVLTDLIKDQPNWQSTPAADLHAAITATDPIRLPIDQARHTAASLADLHGAATTEAMVAALTTAERPVMAQSLIAVGLDFGHPELQGMLDLLGVSVPGVFTPTLVASLKALGWDSRSKWQRATSDPYPDEAEVQASLDAESARVDGRQAYSDHAEALITQPIPDRAAIVAGFRAAADDLEGV